LRLTINIIKMLITRGKRLTHRQRRVTKTFMYINIYIYISSNIRAMLGQESTYIHIYTYIRKLHPNN